MAIIVDDKTKVLVQGITGHQGTFHTKEMLRFGTKVVAGVTPGKGGAEVHGVPVFNEVKEAVDETGANTSLVLVPARFAKDAIIEAIDAGIRTIVVITEHIPFHDTIEIVHYARYKEVTVVGPNCPGVASPGKAKVGIFPNHIFREGDIGVASRSGTLTYEIVDSLSREGFGQSTCVGLGGDPVTGLNFVEVLEMFERDEETRAIVMVGEIGGVAEEEAAEYIKDYISKPVFAFIAGRTAPPEKRMGHAGAIISRGRGTAKSKIEALRKAGVAVAEFPDEIAKLIKENT